MENLVSTPWTLTLNNTTVTLNRAGDAGGGIETDGHGKFNATASTISRNTTVNQGAGYWADAVAVGTVANPTITNGGTGYTAAPTVTFTGGGGTGATGTAVLTNGVVTGIIVTNSGAGYTSNPTITFANAPGDTTGTGATATDTFVATPQSTNVKITTSSINSNIGIAAGSAGGGLGNAGDGLFIVTSSTFANNYTSGVGGAHGDQSAFGTAEFVNDTFTTTRPRAMAAPFGAGLSLSWTIAPLSAIRQRQRRRLFNLFGGPPPAGTASFTLNNTILAGNFAGAANLAGGQGATSTPR